MPKRKKIPVTPAIRVLRAAGVDFAPCPYAYVPRGGAQASSAALGVDLHAVIKTLVMQTEDKAPLLVLMHGDRAVSTRALARALGVRSVTPCAPRDADRHTGYQTGGISPFGTRKTLPIYLQQTIADLPQIWINGGKRGLLVTLAPADLIAVLRPTPVAVTQAG
ncbi:MAG: Cys-tRNA(Pro) deacylase [Myxococcota bacterium]